MRDLTPRQIVGELDRRIIGRDASTSLSGPYAIAYWRPSSSLLPWLLFLSPRRRRLPPTRLRTASANGAADPCSRQPQ